MKTMNMLSSISGGCNELIEVEAVDLAEVNPETGLPVVRLPKPILININDALEIIPE